MLSTWMPGRAPGMTVERRVQRFSRFSRPALGRRFFPRCLLGRPARRACRGAGGLLASGTRRLLARARGFLARAAGIRSGCVGARVDLALGDRRQLGIGGLLFLQAVGEHSRALTMAEL